ncbi:MAG: carboxypeptidase-like regulatory domain-containing protein [Crocinitomicaceae bacterium]|nr:carboxypeptidase-like regulatory domain-containing protein [Crocinitomicaceae bacterium]
MQKIVFILLLVFSFTGYGQYVIKGTVKDEYGQGIPGARVSVENSTYGVPTNANGAYFLEINEKGEFIISYSMLGFETKVDTVRISEKMNIHDVTLIEISTELTAVEVYADKRDIAKEVIKAVVDNKKNMKRQYETYQCYTYIKTGLEKENRIPFMKEEDEPEGRQKMNFTESYSITRFEANDTYKEVILAHQDYSDKSNSSVVVSADFSNPNSLLPTQVIEYNPYIFFEKTEDGEFDPYQNLISLPKISSRPLVSPVAFNTFLNYKFYLKSVFFEDGQKIYDIIVEPRFNESPLFSGNLYIIDSLWVIKSMDLSINSSSMEYFKDFRIIQDYEQIDSNWVPVRREFIYTINDGSDRILANTRVQHSNYEFDLEFDKKEFNNVVMEYEEDAFDKDSAYWADTRPLQLKPEELKFIREQDSITKIVQSDEYIDSVNQEYNKVTFWDVVLSGVGFRSREKKQEIYINPLINQLQFLAVGGYRHRIGGYYSKEFENAQKIRVDGDIDYGFRNKDVKGDLGIEYTYLPRHFGSLKVRGGDIYDIITLEQSLTNLLSGGNFVRNTFIGASQRFEIVNGLYGRLSYDYSTRRSIADIEPAPWQDTLYAIGFWSPPQPYDTYTVSVFELEFLYRFKQQYVIKKGKKIIIGTEYPQLRLTYKKGVPDMFGSDVNFNYVEIGATDEVTFGTFGIMKWDVEAGSFIGDKNNLDNVQFIEQKFFRGSDFFFFSNPLQSLQMLDSTFHTARPFVQAYVIHHFNGALLGKVPLINKLKIEVFGGGGFLYINEWSYRHLEAYIGLERKFKIRKQLFKIAVVYAFRDNSNPNTALFNFKFGVDFFNSWTNKWSW